MILCATYIVFYVALMIFIVKTLCVQKVNLCTLCFSSSLCKENFTSTVSYFTKYFSTSIIKNVALIATGLFLLLPATAEAHANSKQQSKVKIFVGESSIIFSPEKFSQNVKLVFQKQNLQTATPKTTFKSQNTDYNSPKRFYKTQKTYKENVYPVLPFGSSSFINAVLSVSASLPQNFNCSKFFACNISKISLPKIHNILTNFKSGVYTSLPDENFPCAIGNLPPPGRV